MSASATSALAASRPVDVEAPSLDPALVLVLERVRLHAIRRTAWLRQLWDNEHQEARPEAIGHAEIDSYLADCDDPARESRFFTTEEDIYDLNNRIAAVDEALAQQDDTRLAHLHRLFALRPYDSDILQTCIALELDPNLARVFAYLQDHAGRPFVTEALVARLFRHGRGEALHAASPLRLWSLVQFEEPSAGEPEIIRLDRALCAWLHHGTDLDATLISAARRQLAPEDDLDGWPTTATAERIEKLLDAEAPSLVRVSIAGAVGSGRHTFAAGVAARLGLGVVGLDLGSIAPDNSKALQVRAQRMAFLEETALAWSGPGVTEASWSSAAARFPVQFAVLEPEEQITPDPDFVDLRVDLPEPSLAEQIKLWRRHIGGAKRWPKRGVEAVLSRQRLSVGDLAAIGRHAPANLDDIEESIRALTRQRMTEHVQQIECPFELADLIVSPHLDGLIDEVIFEARDRRGLWEREEIRRLFPLGRGLVAILSGPSGTGKTMCAQVIARELGRPLFKVSTASIVSRYVGDSAKRVRRVLSRAAQIDALVLFDECEAFFGKRTEVRDAHDRYANTDTDDLLQAIEAYPGVALLSTNRKGDLDRAFFRRIRYMLDFAKPDAAERYRLWHQLLVQMAGEPITKMNERFLQDLAGQVEVTGAEIKQAVLHALFASRRAQDPLGSEHLLHGLERELTKQGRSLGDRERTRLVTHAA